MWSEPSGVSHVDVLWMWEVMAGAAFVLALLANEVPRRPLRTWVGDLFVRWGIAGLLVWFFTAGLWALREYLNLKIGVPMGPLEAVVEHMTVYGALATGMLSVWVMGVALLANGLFARPVKAASRTPAAASTATSATTAVATAPTAAVVPQAAVVPRAVPPPVAVVPPLPRKRAAAAAAHD